MIRKRSLYAIGAAAAALIAPAALYLSAPVATAAASNLLANPGFESGAQGHRLLGGSMMSGATMTPR